MHGLFFFFFSYKQNKQLQGQILSEERFHYVFILISGARGCFSD